MIEGGNVVDTTTLLDLQDGDFGSWGSGNDTHGVYGHAVAATSFREACVVMFEDTLGRIQIDMDAMSDSLPTLEVEALRRIAVFRPTNSYAMLLRRSLVIL